MKTGLNSRPFTSSPIARAIFIGLGVLVLSSCVDPNASSPGNSLASSWARPDDPQEKIGAKEHPVVLARYGGVYENVKAERMIALIVSKLVAVSDDPTRVYKITLLNSPKVNAFALPGGFLYVTRGLLALANDSSEVAAVIAHEMAHVTANHALIRQDRLNSDELGKQVASDVLGNSTQGKIAIAANRIRLTQFSQEQELQADAIGIRTIGRAGYDPYAGARFLKTMAQYQAYLNGGRAVTENDFTSSHPSTPKRVDLAKRHARFFGAPGIGNRDVVRYLEGIDGLMFGDSADEGYVRGQSFLHAGLGISFDAPTGFVIDNQPKAVLIYGPDNLDTRFDAVLLSPRTELVEFLKSGWIRGLVEDTIKTETVNGLDAASAISLDGGLRFKVRVIRNGRHLYRFITVSSLTNPNLDAVSWQMAQSLKILDAQDIANLKPLRIRIATVEAGQNQQSMIAQMKGITNPEALFRALNAIRPGENLSPGRKVKLVQY